MAAVTKQNIKDGLAELGLVSGDRIIVHSSLSSLGHVAGGAATVCRAFMETVTEDGTLMMPSFNHGAAFKDGGCYDPLVTPTTNGAIPQAFWQMAGVYRSLNPTHPVACWGSNARELLRGHHRVTTMGTGSPLELLERRGGKVVLVNTPRANTYHHVVEMTTNAPCLGPRMTECPGRLPGGRAVRLRTWLWRNASCPITDQGQLYYAGMRAAGTLRELMIGTARVSCFRMADCRAELEPYLAGEHAGLGCAGCTIRPNSAADTVCSDWDAEAQRIRDGSTAYVGPWLDEEGDATAHAVGGRP